VHFCSKAKVSSTGAVAKASLKMAFKLQDCGPKPRDLHMSRLHAP
jgi:hypothetical protein